jgi:hypothetical protein
MKKAFPHRKFIIPMEAGLAVCKGAVLFGHDPDVILSRICRYTYGQDICKPFDEAIHPVSKFTIIENNLLCKDIFLKFFTVGQEVSLGEANEMISTMSFVDDSAMLGRFLPIHLRVYVSDQKYPMYVDDEGCRELGVIEVKCNNGVWPPKVLIKTKMEIARTEIKVTSTMDTGEEVSTNFDFL